MQVDDLSLAAKTSFSSAERNILLEEKQLKLQNKMETDIYKTLKTRRFILTPVYDLALLQSTGMDAKFKIIFKTVGWEKAWEVDEPGCKLLTAEFLCTLQFTDSEVTFRLFGK